MALYQLSSVLVKPVSADCNLDCTYCFYRPKLDLYPETKWHCMSEEVLESFIAQYMRLAGLQASFGWQGGEPTLAGLAFFEKVVAFQQQYGFPGQLVGNGLQTNGTLLDDDWARFLRRYNFLVGVSLDGPPEFHDHYRTHRGGQPSFDRVMAGIEALKRHRVEFNILVLLNDRNVKHPREVWQFLRDHDFHYLQFIPCVERDPATGQPTPYSITAEEYGEFLCVIFDEWLREDRPPTFVRLFDDVLAQYVQGENPCCIFRERCGDYVVIEHNGDVYACDFFVEPEWRIGNLMETPLAKLVASDHLETFRQRKMRLAPACRACRWQEFCHGGCCKYRMVLTNDPAQPTYFCAAYRRFFAHSEAGFKARKRQFQTAQRLQLGNMESGKWKVENGKRKTGTRSPTPNPQPSISNLQSRVAANIGRNDPCPCGSGRKFKKCCLGKG